MTLLCLRDIMNNKVFYQHPNLMRVLGMHETVMEVMVNVLGGDKSQVGWQDHTLVLWISQPLLTNCMIPVCSHNESSNLAWPLKSWDLKSEILQIHLENLPSD